MPPTASTSASTSSKGPPYFKLLLIGASSVGKSSLLLRFTDDSFLPSDEATATIGVDFKSKQIDRRGQRYKLNIWDTAGQERFRALTSSYYRGAQGVILVYDVTNRESFESLTTWLTELETFSNPDIVKIIVGNKTDKDSQRMVSTSEGKEFAQDKGCLFIEASAKRGYKVDLMFELLVDKILDTPALINPQPPVTNDPKSPPGGFPLTSTEREGVYTESCSC